MRFETAAKTLSATPTPEAIDALVEIIHGRNVEAGWWSDLASGEPLDRNDAEMIALMHSELSEAFDGKSRVKRDDHLPHRLNTEVEMADTVIRIFDYCGGRGIPLGRAVKDVYGAGLIRPNIIRHQLVAAQIAQMHSELSKALEGIRKGLRHETLTQYSATAIGLACCVARVIEFCRWEHYDLPGAVVEKANYNKTRADHKLENRRAENGKKF